MEEEQRSGMSTERTSRSFKPCQKNSMRSTSSVDDPGTALSSKRRRGPGFVTPNACNECKKKRVKCDGTSPCGRCKSQKNVKCVYEVPVRRSKENLRHEIEGLRNHQRQSNSILSALVQPDLREEVLRKLRGGQPIATISDSLNTAVSCGAATLSDYGGPVEAKSDVVSALQTTYRGSVSSLGALGPGAADQAVAQASTLKQDGTQFEINSPWTSLSPSQSLSQPTASLPEDMQWTSEALAESLVVPLMPQGPDQSADEAKSPGVNKLSAFPNSKLQVPPSTWTNVTRDSALVQHLLALYFCWEYPTFASLSKEHFLRDYLHGRQRYCSSILVNALLALGCRFSTQPETRADPNDPSTSGDHFFRESLRLLYKESEPRTVTTVQALGIMSIREASCGRDSESWYYAGQSVQLATEMGLHQLHVDGGDPDDLAVGAATFWGAFSLDHAWSLATGSLPHSSQFLHLPPTPAIVESIEISLWTPYPDDGAPLHRSCEQPSNVRSVYRCFCELSQLVHQCLYVLRSPGRPPTSRDLLNLYTQFLNWYDSAPAVLRLGQNFTPAVLFAHMYYHFAILLLFSPLIKLRIVGSSILPRDVCSQAADAIHGLLRSYAQLYTLRRTPCFMPYFLLTASIMHLAIGASTMEPAPRAGELNAPTSPSMSPHRIRLSPKISTAIKQSISYLAEMAPCHHFAEKALHILRFMAMQWNIDVDVPCQGAREDFEKIVRPSTDSLNFFVPNVSAEDFMRAVSTGPSQHEDVIEMAGSSKRNSETKSSSLTHCGARASENGRENPLFWPFPQQGRPILAEGSHLEEAGFVLL
ncbi:fungal-specific transcription factor domain-containing protein [Xylaria sp. CBS 124048]|nr:fungal-specific transcription factor domain-containing protein [Xylaria sp. CBS 124048]